MKFDILLNQLKSLNLPTDQFVIVSSGALGVRKIRDVQDLDIVVSDQLWEQLKLKYPLNVHQGIEQIELGEDLECLGDGSFFHNSTIASLEDILNTADVIEGIRYMNLELLKKFKTAMGRDKDLKDLELIREYKSKN